LYQSLLKYEYPQGGPCSKAQNLKTIGFDKFAAHINEFKEFKIASKEDGDEVFIPVNKDGDVIGIVRCYNEGQEDAQLYWIEASTVMDDFTDAEIHAIFNEIKDLINENDTFDKVHEKLTNFYPGNVQDDGEVTSKRLLVIKCINNLHFLDVHQMDTTSQPHRVKIGEFIDTFRRKLEGIKENIIEKFKKEDGKSREIHEETQEEYKKCICQEIDNLEAEQRGLLIDSITEIKEGFFYVNDSAYQSALMEIAKKYKNRLVLYTFNRIA